MEIINFDKEDSKDEDSDDFKYEDSDDFKDEDSNDFKEEDADTPVDADNNSSEEVTVLIKILNNSSNKFVKNASVVGDSIGFSNDFDNNFNSGKT